ncbi:TPA: MBL fold metallo-hydrolase [Candidatus Bathyarchaeota archaeon]|nr:MBL fold metallo-hydrolase [Candidatus Bathyarchaeota archaeon]
MKKIDSQILCFRTAFTNSYLVKLPNGYLLVDTGYQNRYEQFLEELKATRIELHEITYLMLTHHHEDHAGFARKLLLNSKAKLVIHENALPFLAEGTHENRGEHWNPWVHQLITPFSRILSHKYPPLKIRKDDIILQNDNPMKISDLGLNGKIVYTPGHSSDSISLVLQDGKAIVGDAAMNLLNLGETRYRPFFIQDIDDVFGSWKKLIEFEVRTIYPSHGRPFSVEKLIRNLHSAKTS